MQHDVVSFVSSVGGGAAALAVVAVKSVKPGGIEKNLACLGEAGLAAKRQPGGGVLGQVAGGDVVVDLAPLLVREEGPSGPVDAPEARQIGLAILALGQGRLVDHRHVARGAADRSEQLALAVGGEMVDRQTTPGNVSRLRLVAQRLDEIAVVELDRE